jgi:alpha-L-rhamnosidase
MKANELKTEYLVKPLGLDIANPRFFWNCEGGMKQTAYRIVAVRESETVWDSGKTQGNRMTHIRYEGQPLKSRDRVTWSVTLWDENDVEGEKTSSWFELGLLKAEDWQAHWIAGDYKSKKNTRYPVDCFQKTFFVSKRVTHARLYITSCGLYEACLNGERVGSFVLAPGSTDYRYRLQYQVYALTETIAGGENRLEVQLADGWYRGSIGCWGAVNVFGRQTKLLCQLELFFDDGTTETIISDESFLWSSDGPLRFADLKDGEIYDASKKSGYGGRARIVQEKIIPSASNNVQVGEHEEFSAKLIITPSGKKVLDFGQNIAGFVAFTVKGKPGQKLRLLCGETLDENGEFTQKNFQSKKPVKEYGKITEILLITGNESKIKSKLTVTPKQEIEFICSGGQDQYKTAFAVFGFRYALIETDIDIDPAQFRAIAVYSDMEQTGTFSCSNEKVNRFLENTRWSMKGNFLDVPTDCPTRERLPWTGESQIFFKTASYLMNVASFYHKWMNDMKDDQFKNGKSSAVVPYNGLDLNYKSVGASVGWGDAVVLVPYRYWKRYGDESIIRDFYEVMRKYAVFMIKNTGHKNKKAAAANPYNKYTYEKGIHLGEWLEPEEFRDKVFGGRVLYTEECTAYLHYTMRHMAEIADFLGNAEDKALFAEYAEGAKKSYEWLFLQKGIATDRQAKLVRPLAMNLADGEKKAALQKRLLRAVENRGFRIGTGFLSTPFILSVLAEAGHLEAAYRMLENEEAPSWLAEVNAGATTVWETWDGDVSLNHYSPGAVCEWLFASVAGINVAGENRFIIKPLPGGSLGFARAEYRSIYGAVSTEWQRDDAAYTLTVTIPPNTAAEVLLPNGERYTVTAGTHTYTFERNARETGLSEFYVNAGNTKRKQGE